MVIADEFADMSYLGNTSFSPERLYTDVIAVGFVGESTVIQPQIAHQYGVKSSEPLLVSGFLPDN
jgi:hypothetical protein